MNPFDRSVLSDAALLRACHEHLASEAATLATVLADLAELDARRLYRPAAYPSMFAFCVGELKMSEDSALKRIQVARAARQHPALLEAIAERRIHLGAARLLVPHLLPENASELVRLAEGRTCEELREALARRCPRPDVATSLVPLDVPTMSGEHATWHVGATSAEDEHATWHVGMTCTEQPVAPKPVDGESRATLAPLAPERYELRGTMGQEMRDDLRAVQALLGPTAESRDVMAVLGRALKLLRVRLEARKCAKTARPRPGRSRGKGRAIPAPVKRAVWARDGGRCTFTSEQGKRCEARAGLEFDHVIPVARGGRSTAGNLRLRCRAHNQLEAERAFGVAFMAGKRERAREGRALRRTGRDAAHDPSRRRRGEAAVGEPAIAEVIPWLCRLGFARERALHGARVAVASGAITLEDRVRQALRALAPPHTTVAAARAPARPPGLLG